MAEGLLKPPTELKVTEGNVSENFRQWRRQVELFLLAIGAEEKPKIRQKAIILHCAGPQAQEICEQLQHDENEDVNDPQILLKKLHDYYNPRKNEVLESFRFWNIEKVSSCDVFITQLRAQAEKCNFKEKDRMIRDKIIFAVEKRLQERLLNHDDLTLKKCIEICQTYEQTAKGLAEINKETVVKIDKIEQKKNDNRNNLIDCWFCGGRHAVNRTACPAWGKNCNKCKGKNHFAVKCKTKNKIHMHNAMDEFDQEEQLNSINVLNINRDRMTALFMINSQQIRFQLDTGADVNIIYKKYVKKTQIKKSVQTLTMWNNSKLKNEGTANLVITNPKNKKNYLVTFTVVENHYQCLLGRKTCQSLSLITLNEDRFISQVNTMDCHLGDLGETSLTINENIAPVVSPCRNIPFAFQKKVEAEIETLVKRKILIPVNEPTDWVSQMAVVQKPNGDLRICIEPRHLNTALKREHFKLPTLEAVMPQFLNAKIFSKLDVKEAYWHVRLDEKSSLLTTMITPYGRYRWSRLPFGLSVIGEIFQKKLTEALLGLEGCINVADDIVIVGCGQSKEEAEKDHSDKLKRLRERCK
ncbi:Retrovirus-related Pol polyprotein [Biomphalaria glabrata]|nr:Retrovirus-related Pol polyprotein [Biomphalaria glabrata]